MKISARNRMEERYNVALIKILCMGRVLKQDYYHGHPLQQVSSEGSNIYKKKMTIICANFSSGLFKSYLVMK